MDGPRLYHDLAWLWPLCSPPEDYAVEAGYWRRVLAERLGPGPYRVLELGVGGGHNLSHLTDVVQATAVDISPAMLELSRRLNPGVEHLQGDMRALRLGRTFDAVLLHDAASYLLGADEVRRACATAAAHLRPGGVFVAAPDYYTETFVPDQVDHDTRRHGDLTLTRLELHYDRDPDDEVAEAEIFFVIRQGGEVRVEHDHHVTGLLPLARWLALMAEAGFAAEAVDYPVHEGPVQAYLLVGVLGGGAPPR